MADLTIADVRAKFPQYDDLSDQQLADALHQRYYSDMDQADFYGRIGFDPAQAAPAAGPAEFADQAQSLEFPTPPAPRPDPRVAPAMPPMPAAPSAPPTVQAPVPARPEQPDPLVAALQPAAPTPTPTPTPTQAVPARPMPVNPVLQTQGPGPGGGMGQLYDQGILPRRYVEDPLAGAMAPQAPAPVEENPFANEGFGALAQRRGQQFARGATEAFAAVPEAIAVQMANADQRDVASGEYKMALADQYEAELGQIATRIGEIEVALGINGNPRPSRENRLDSEQRAALEAEYQEIMGRRNQINLAIGEGGLEAYRADALADMTTRANLNEEGVVTPAGDREMFSYGDVVRDASTNTFGAPDPRDTSFWAGFAEGGGNMTGMAITALATSAVTTPLGGVAMAGGQGAAMNSSQMYREAIQMGADEETARLAANWGAAIGASEIIPINRALKLLPPRLRGQIGQGFLRRFADIAQSSGEEAAQEYLATVANNIVADNLYDPGRGWTEGATEAALVGAILGAGTGTVGTLLDSRGDAPANARPEAPEATPGAETPPEVAPEPTTPQAPAAGDAPNAPSAPEPPTAPRQAPAQPTAPTVPVAPDPLTATMGASPAREEAALDVADAMAPPPADGGRFEIMDEVETVDGESVPTGRQVRVNLDTGEVSPVDPASAPEQREAVQSQPQDAPDVGTDDAPAAGEAEDAGSPEANSAGDAAISSIRTETLPSEAVAQVETDAATFQYKDNGDEAGVTDRLQGITDWDERSAMGGIIFEYADGRRVVADGHQRLGLAKRLQQNGVRTPWNVEIIRETDGFTPADVRRIAALKNIREGSGTAIDAAKVLRETPDDIDSLNLPPRSALVRNARGLARLSDDAFGMVVNEVVRPEWGATVGENVADQALHADVVSLLNKLQPKNNAQAAMIAQQAGQEAVTETQTSLFGDEQVAESLYLERAKVLDAALKRLKQDRATFKVLSDRANTISEEGNVLNSEANAQRVEADSKAAAYLTAEANRKGPISDALTAAARDLKANPRQGARVVRDFLEALRTPAGSEPQGTGSDRGRADPQAKPRQEGVDQPQTETTDAGEQSLFPGIEPVTDRQRAEADMAKPMSGRDTGPASGRDDLFGNPEDRRDLFDDAPSAEDKSTVGTFVDRATDADDALFKDRSTDLPDRIPAAKLAAEARRLTLEPGRKDGIEYLMLIDGEGQIVAYGSGHETGTGVPGAMMLMGEGGERIVAHHNHPSSNGFSGSDLAFALMPGAEIIYAHGHDGSTFAVRSTALGRSMWAGARNEFERQAQIAKDLSTAMDNMWRKSHSAIGRLVDDGTYAAEPDNGKPAGTYLQPGRDRSFAFMLAMEQAGIVEIEVTGPAAARFKADVNPYLLDPELKKLYENLVRTLRRRVKDADTEGNYDRPTAARRHPGELASSPEAPATDQARQPDDGGRDQAGQGRDPREGSQSSVADADFLGALDDVFGADTDQAQDGQIQITEPPKKRAKADIAKDMQAVLRGLKEDSATVDDGKYRQLAPLFAEALDGIDPTAQSRREAFGAMMRPLVDAGLTREDVQALQPYFTRFLDDVEAGKIDLEGDANASGTGSDLEPDRGDTDAGDGLGGTDVPAAAGTDGPRADQGRGAADAEGGQRQGGGRVSDGDAAPVGTQSDQGVPGRERDGGQPADDRDGAGSRDRGEQGLPADPGRAEDTAQYASDAPDVVDRKAAQAEADAAKVIPGDRANIDKTLPLLLPEQRDDVWKVEQRFGKTDKDGNPIGHGMLLTNGTGTGKTYSGGGVIKRFAQQGKDNILILAPSQGILDAWVEMGADMGLDISKLEDTTSAGTGIVATTYANAGENVELAKRDWDLVVTDESQKLSQNATGDQTGALRTVRAITNRPENLLDKARMLLAKEWAKVEAMPEGSEQRNAAQRAAWEQTSAKAKELVGKERSKVLFLSATPFAYDKNVDYAEGYLFQYGADGVTESGSRQDGRNLFFVENFGYRIRYHKLTKPEAAVDNGVFEREFHERLKREGVLSGRSLDIAADYDRKFVKISSADGEQIDAAMRLISDKSDNTPTGRKWRELGDHVRRNFTYLRRLQLLEAIKAEASVSDIKAHLDMGRKVVVFHDYNKGGGFNPFMGRDVVTPTADAMEGYKLLLQEMPEVADLNFSGLGSPIETLTAAFGKRARVYNGTVSQKERAAAKSEFNRDGSGVDVIIVQSAAGEAGISLHDTTGGHQRALINLGMPVRPTTTLQEEGRIRRVGSVSDAVFRYYTTGTAWERQAFAGKIAENSGTVENLALGNEARAIREAFISAYMDAGDYKPSLEDGRGGRDADRSTATTSPYDQAKTHYFARTKNNQKRDRRAGFDFYATPEPLGFKMAEWAKVRTYEKVLEPSAGDGAIARYFPGDADRTIIEPSMDLITKAQLRAPGSKAIQEQFEDHYIGNKYDAVVMNPPFGSGGKMAMEHMAKAARHLRPGGRLVALVPTGPAADKQLAKQMTDGEPLADLQWTADISLPSVTFEKAGTSVAARVVIFDKVGKDANENPQTKRINMRGAQSISDFFDRLEDIDVPERPAVTERAEEVEGVVSPAPVSESNGLESFEFKNTKTGADVYGVQITESLGDRFKEVAGIAKSHGGYYSRYQNKAAGARRGFLFKSDKDRAAFIEDVQKPRFGLEETSTEFPADPRANPAFRRWFGDSKVVDERGAPLVLWHGTALRKYTPEWDSFKGMTWGARDAGLAIDYANARAAMSKGGEYYARLHELFMRIERPFNADLGVPRTVQIDDITNALIEQAEAQGRPLDDAKGQRMAELIETLQEARVREESGPSYSRHDFWNDTASLFGRDGSDAIAEMFELLGFDGITMIENGVETWGAFRPEQVKGRYNRGTFDPETDKFMERRGQTTAEAIVPAMPALRAELDRLNLKRVKLNQDTSGQRLGAFRADTDGALEILIGPSLDPEATLYHESIHAMRTLNLFTPQEWRALEIKAAKTWVEQHDIAKRYPDLLPSEQIEEAIAEAFADAAKTRTAPQGSILVQAFNKIARLLKALGNSLRGAGFQTAEDVFGRAMAGEIGARDAGNTGFAATMREARGPARKRQTAQQRTHSATAMNANGGFAYIPDRRIWEELSASGAGIWQRLRGGAAAANDWADKARIKIQDRFLPVLRAQEAIIRSTGQPISEEQNAYLAEETFSGKVGRHLFEIDEDFTKRIIDIMAGGKGEAMLDAEYVGNWLYARHAQERNARIASINPNIQDGGSGMTNAESAQILADAAASPNAARLQEIGDLIDELRERTLKLRKDAGLITPEEADLWRNQYKHYVPLKGFADTDHSEAMLDVTGMGRRFNTRGAETKRALGRRSEAFNPLQGAITQAQEVAIRAEKNRVGQALYKLAKDFPSPDLWSVKTPAQKRFYNRTTGLVETRVEDPVSLFLEPNELAVKINGQERRILFHDNRLAQAAGTVGADQMNWFIGLMSKASRWFSSVNTMLDPEFVIRNAFRDMTAAQINIRNFGQGDRNALAKAMIKNWPKAWRAAYRGQLNKTDTEWDKYYREFDQAGAKVSFWKLEQPEAEMQDLARRVKMAGGNLGQRASRFLRISTRDNPVLGFIERVNLAVDNAIRLAAYVEARKQGWSKSDAASLSKNLTVNFNRRGEWGASINALYPFANAGIQGTQILFRAMTSKRMAKYALGMVALGFILDQINAAMSEEDEDGELAYDKIPEWKRQMNLIVMLGPESGHAATVWLPYGYNLFPYMGQQLSRITRGVQEPGDAMGDFAGAMFGSFSPLGGRDLQSVLTPTMLDPINEMAMNQDWLGRPIRPENPYSDYGPDAYKYFGGASIASREIADAMNRATGGSIAEPGFIDVSPEYIDHAFGFATGGAGRFWGRTTDTLGKLLRGEIDDIEARNIPFYRSLQYETGDWLDRDRYYRFREQVREARDAMQTYQDAGMPVPDSVRRTAGLYDASREAERALREMRSATRGLEARDDLSAAEISERRAAIDERAANVYLRFNQIFVRVNGPQGE